MPNRAIAWDIYEEHLDEATFLWRQWERAHESPGLTRAELAESTEARLLAHLDALALGGYRVAETLLLPALRSTQPFRRAVAAHVLLLCEEGDQTGPVTATFARAEEAALPSLTRALALARRPELGARLARLVENGETAVEARVLTALGACGADTEPLALRLAARGASALDDERLATLLAAPVPHAAPFSLAPFVLEGLQRQSTTVRLAALLAGAQSALRVSLSTSFAWAEAALGLDANDASAPPPLRLPLSLLVLAEPRGATSETGELVRLLALRARRSTVRAEAAWALGLQGTCANAAACLSALEDPAPEVAAQALDSFALMTGLPLEGAFVRPSLAASEERSASERDDLAWRADRLLPLPTPSAVYAWWHGRAARFAAGPRWLLGQSLASDTPEARRALEEAPLWRRGVLALELGLRASPGTGGLAALASLRPRPRWAKDTLPFTLLGARSEESAPSCAFAFERPFTSFFAG